MRFGPVFGGFDIFSVADPELVQAVMKSKDYGLSVLAKRMFTRTLGKYVHKLHFNILYHFYHQTLFGMLSFVIAFLGNLVNVQIVYRTVDS